jgi:branched-chain amino acid transport system ATP-binding protein
MTTPLLEVRGVESGYGRTQILRGISIRLDEGEHIGLVGLNGHGKTTLLRTISGLIPTWSGEVLLRGERVTGQPPRKIVEQGLIHVAQGNALFPQMTVLENLKLGAYPHRARHLAATSLEQVFQLFPRLAERRSQVSRTLSGGERQMLSIGVGLMSAPSILMLDEPTLGLSPKLKFELRDAIERIQKTGVPTLVVEQDVEFLASLSQRFYLVDQGQVSAEFTAEQGLDHAEIMEMYLGVA